MKFLDWLLGRMSQQGMPSPDDSDSSSEREQSASCLQMKGSVHREAIVQIITALSDKDMRVEDVAAQALGKIGDEKAAEGFGVPSSDEDTDIGKMVAQAFEKIGGESAIEGLITALSGKGTNLGGKSDHARESAICPSGGEEGSVGVASLGGSGNETDRDMSRPESKKDVASTIPGFWECYYNHRDTPDSDLLKISRRADQIEIMYVDRGSLYGPKYPEDKYYDIHLDANGIRYRFTRDERQASVELRLIDENILKGSCEDAERGKADYELRRVSESDLWLRKR